MTRTETTNTGHVWCADPMYRNYVICERCKMHRAALIAAGRLAYCYQTVTTVEVTP